MRLRALRVGGKVSGFMIPVEKSFGQYGSFTQAPVSTLVAAARTVTAAAIAIATATTTTTTTAGY